MSDTTTTTTEDATEVCTGNATVQFVWSAEDGTNKISPPLCDECSEDAQPAETVEVLEVYDDYRRGAHACQGPFDAV